MTPSTENAKPLSEELSLLADKQGFVGPTFTLTNRVRRLAWRATWLLFARWTPVPMHKWRVAVLRAWGADIDWSAYVYPDVTIWAPWHLLLGRYATLGPGVICYNIAPVSLGSRAIVSQRAHLCTGSHDYRTTEFPLVARPVAIGRRAWICAEAFVGPGVSIGDGAVLSARGVTFLDLLEWTVYSGNHAVAIRSRPILPD